MEFIFCYSASNKISSPRLLISFEIRFCTPFPLLLPAGEKAYLIFFKKSAVSDVFSLIHPLVKFHRRSNRFRDTSTREQGGRILKKSSDFMLIESILPNFCLLKPSSNLIYVFAASPRIQKRHQIKNKNKIIPIWCLYSATLNLPNLSFRQWQILIYVFVSYPPPPRTHTPEKKKKNI